MGCKLCNGYNTETEMKGQNPETSGQTQRVGNPT